jgi:hypothetical protein
MIITSIVNRNLVWNECIYLLQGKDSYQISKFYKAAKCPEYNKSKELIHHLFIISQLLL